MTILGLETITTGAAPAQLDRLLGAFGDFIDTATGPIGRVVGSEREPAGSHEFFFWASDTARTLDVGHIVVTFSEDAVVIGVVDEPRRFSDLRSFLDDYFDRHVEDELDEDPPTRRPEILVFTVNVLATKHLRDDVTSHRPPTGGPVYFATPEAIEYATGIPEFTGRAIPALLHTNGNPEHGRGRHADERRATATSSSSALRSGWTRIISSAPKPVTATGPVNPASRPRPATSSS